MPKNNILTRSKKIQAEKLLANNRLAEAKKLYERVCRRDRRDVETRLKLADIYKRLGNLVEAEKCCRQAQKIAPGNAYVLHCLGIVLQARGMPEDALKAYSKALKINPTLVGACNNAANILATTNRLAEAVAYYERALILKPNSFEVYNNLGHALRMTGRSAQAEPYFRKATELQPNSSEAFSNLLLCLNYIAQHDPHELLTEHKRWAQKFTSHLPHHITHPNPADGDRRLRIAYISRDFRQHPVASFFTPILENHDLRSCEIICYSDVPNPDSITQYLRSKSQKWRDICGLTDEAVANMIRNDRIDILVDLAGHTSGNRLMVLARKPAPVQITYLGYPATTGLTTIDYLLTDKIADPPGTQHHYTERLIYLDTGFSCYKPPTNAPKVMPSPARENGFVTFGSLNMLGKLDENVINLWCRILQSVPSSQLLIFRWELRGKIKDQLLATFQKKGLSTERINLLSEPPKDQNHFSVYSLIDIALDTFPWSGHTTACEALWMGVPVITLCGSTRASRMTSSVLHQLGLTNLSARSMDGYLQAAITLALDADGLIAIRAGLRNRMISSPLCDSKAFTTCLESAYRSMWRTWCSEVGSA